MTRRCLLVGLNISVVWVDDCGRYGPEKVLAVKVAISTTKYMWSCQLRRCPLCRYVYTSQDSKMPYSAMYAVRICFAKLKSFLRKRKCESQKLRLIPTSEIGRKGNERTPGEKKHEIAYDSLRS